MTFHPLNMMSPTTNPSPLPRPFSTHLFRPFDGPVARRIEKGTCEDGAAVVAQLIAVKSGPWNA